MKRSGGKLGICKNGNGHSNTQGIIILKAQYFFVFQLLLLFHLVINKVGIVLT